MFTESIFYYFILKIPGLIPNDTLYKFVRNLIISVPLSDCSRRALSRTTL